MKNGIISGSGRLDFSLEKSLFHILVDVSGDFIISLDLSGLFSLGLLVLANAVSEGSNKRHQKGKFDLEGKVDVIPKDDTESSGKHVLRI